MGRESVTKFDLEAAFKALDEVTIPEVEGGPRANRVDLQEYFNAKDGFDKLNEDYYNINDQKELEEAKEDREAEVAKAKLARIEKIVDLDAETEDELLPTYVGKTIIQCPQCMTLFYKDPADIERSEDDPNIVNVNEKCQHCGNLSGYMLIGKVAAEEPEVKEPAPESTEEDQEKPNVEEPEKEGEEEVLPPIEGEEKEEQPEEPSEEAEPSTQEANSEDEDDLGIDIDLNDLDLENSKESKEEEKEEKKDKDKEEEEDKKQESLQEDTKKLDDGKWANVGDDGKVDSGTFKTKKAADAQRKAMYANGFKEDADIEIDPDSLLEDADDGLDTLFNSSEFKQPISDLEVKSYLEDVNNDEEDYEDVDIEEIDEKSFNDNISKYLSSVYPKILDFFTTDCELGDEDLTIIGTIRFKSNDELKYKPTKFNFCPVCKDENNVIKFKGNNKDICKDDAFELSCQLKDKNLFAECLSYKYKVNEKLIEGKTN